MQESYHYTYARVFIPVSMVDEYMHAPARLSYTNDITSLKRGRPRTCLNWSRLLESIEGGAQLFWDVELREREDRGDRGLAIRNMQRDLVLLEECVYLGRGCSRR